MSLQQGYFKRKQEVILKEYLHQKNIAVILKLEYASELPRGQNDS